MAERIRLNFQNVYQFGLFEFFDNRSRYGDQAILSSNANFRKGMEMIQLVNFVHLYLVE